MSAFLIAAQHAVATPPQPPPPEGTPWWATLLIALFTGGAFAAIVRAWSLRDARRARVTIEGGHAGARVQVAAEREDTERTRLEHAERARVDSLAERMLNAEREAHAGTRVQLVAALTDRNVEGRRIAVLETEVEECHEHSDRVYEWMERNIAPRVQEPMPARRVRPRASVIEESVEPSALDARREP